MKNSPVGESSIMRTHRGTYEQADMTKLTVVFRNFCNRALTLLLFKAMRSAQNEPAIQ